MKTPKIIQGFDAVSFKHAAASSIYRKIRGMSHRQELEFWRNARPIREETAVKKRLSPTKA